MSYSLADAASVSVGAPGSVGAWGGGRVSATLAAGLVTLGMAAGGCGGGTEAGDAGPDAFSPDAYVEPPDAGVDAVVVDAYAIPDAGTVCGDGIAEGAEECDDGNSRANDGCSPICTLDCGDGTVTGDESCDPAIATGRPGACPTTCDDATACTIDTLVGAGGCDAHCEWTEVTLARDGDGCCPLGASSLTDGDCPIVCGNGLLEAGELCDTAILRASGECPTACDDGAVCTRDALVGGGTCTAHCEATEISAPSDGDGCCPAGATVSSDADCSPTCGDGVLSPSDGELCDTAIASGMGSCPTSCDDGMVCTSDILSGAGTCTASCAHPVRPPAAGDGCCPPGATVASDTDCPVRCGDGVRTPPESCDDGNMVTGDGCSPTCTREPRAYRFSSLQVQDPRFLNTSGFDVTPEVNMALRTAVTMDTFGMTGAPDGVLDVSIVLRFDPLDQDAMSVPVVTDLARCTAPIETTVCTPISPVANTVTNRVTGECLGPYPGTLPPGRVVNTPNGPCFSSDGDVAFSLVVNGGVLNFQHAQIGAQYVGDPARQLVTGLLRGFLSETDAGGVMISGATLIDVLRPIDRDTYMGESGWWFYMAFTADPVTYVYP